MAIEGERFEAISVEDTGTTGFAAFLDGVQQSHVVDYAGTIPIVGARIAAVIRTRVERRMTTWNQGYVTDSQLYAPRRLLDGATLRDFEARGLVLRDTLEPDEEIPGHPLELLRRAVDTVKRDRERLERDLAEAWVATTEAPLFVDGTLPAGTLASRSRGCVGVVKSHHTIYAPDDALPTVLELRENERCSAFLVERAWGPRVLSWYLRLRQPPSHDPFMGLVRVEVAWTPDLEASATRTTGRAAEVSAWILAERAPLALPDERWDRMAYGIRDCEEYLRARAS